MFDYANSAMGSMNGPDEEDPFERESVGLEIISRKNSNYNQIAKDHLDAISDN